MKHFRWIALVASMLLGLTGRLFANAYIEWSSAPSEVNSGQSYYVAAHGWSDSGGLSNVNVWKNGSPFAFQGGGDGWNEWAGNATADHGHQYVSFMAESYEYGWNGSGVIYWDVLVRNTLPSVSWNNVPSSVWPGNWYTVRADGYDPDNNMSGVHIYKNGNPFAFELVGNHTNAYSDNPDQAGNGGTSATFRAEAYDVYGWGGSIYHTVSYLNREPSAYIDNHKVIVYIGDFFSFTAYGSDPDNNLQQVKVHRSRWEDTGGTFVIKENFALMDTIWSPNGGPVSRYYEHIAGKPFKSSYNYWVSALDNLGLGVPPPVAFQALLVNRTPLPPTLVPGRTTYRIGDTPIVISGSGVDQDSNATFQYLWVQGPGQAAHEWTLISGVPDNSSGTTYYAEGTGNTVVNYNFTPTQTGTYKFKTRVDDPYNYTVDVIAASITVDITPPPAPTGLHLESIAREGATPLYVARVEWTVSNTHPLPNDVQSQKYGYYQSPNGPETAGTFGVNVAGSDIVNLAADTPYVFWVKARDFAGNESPKAEIVFTTPLLPEADKDSDGMPNGWEALHQFDPRSAADADLDPDYDGLPNVLEYKLGKNPRSYDASPANEGNMLPAGWSNQGDTTNPKAVGATVGELSVDKNGAATYSIPIWVSPGTGGMQPQVGLNYSSQGGNGIAGFGWSLSGISQIARGPRTRAVDNAVGGVDFTTNDRFYLDGQRLIAIPGHTDGAPGSEYRTEIESFTKVVAHGTSGNGPAWFEAWTKSGLIIEFGNTADSAFNPAGSGGVLTWSVSKIRDTKGNYMTFTYAEDTALGKHKLERIDYTGNAGAGLSPYASLRFEYEARNDWVSGYRAGVLITNEERLKTIKSYVGTTLIRTYTLSYVAQGPSSRSLLDKVTETGKDNKSYPDLIFEYEQNTPGFASQNSGIWVPPTPTFTKQGFNSRPTQFGTGFVDLNGDGRPDFVHNYWDVPTSTTTQDARLNTPSGWVWATGGSGQPDYRPPFPLGYSNNNDTSTRLADLDGDGRVDLLWHHVTGNGIVQSGAYRSTATGWDDISSSYAPPFILSHDNDTSPRGAFLVDLNGDGRTDLIAHGSGNVRLNTGTGWTYASQWQAPCDMRGGVVFVDVNGDGLPDILQNWSGNGNLLEGVHLNTGNGWESHTSGSVFNKFRSPAPLMSQNPDWGVNAPRGSEFVDLNGDGLVDLIARNDAAGNTIAPKAWFNTGNGWVDTSTLTSGYTYTPNLTDMPSLRNDHESRGAAFADLNGDGLVDMVHAQGGVTSAVFYNNGHGWNAKTTGSEALPWPLYTIGWRNQNTTELIDLNGDGLVDQTGFWWDGGTTYSAAAQNLSNPRQGRLKKVTNGFGVKAQIVYKPLTDSSVYTKGTGAVFPVIDVISPMQVVAQIKHDDGLVGTGTYDINYTYEGLRAHADRGSLGFALMSVEDSRTTIETTTTFRQDFPYIGMPDVTTTTVVTPGGIMNLGGSTVTYGHKTSHGGKVYFPVATSTLATSFDLSTDYTVDLTSKTRTSVPNLATDVDANGNITQLVVESLDLAGNPIGYKKVTESVYTDDTPNWRLGRLTRATVKSYKPGDPTPITRVSDFAYDPTSGLLTQEIIEPLNATYSVTTAYTYDSFGNKLSATASGQGVLSRTTSSTYTTDGRFALTSTNALNQAESYTTDPHLAVPTSFTNVQGITTSYYDYDGFGRNPVVSSPTSLASTYLRWAGSGAYVPANAKFFVESSAVGSPPSITFKDALGRTVRTMTLDGNGAIVYQDTEYDATGRTRRTSTPYRNHVSTAHWSETTQFDQLGRPLEIVTPDDQNNGAVTSFFYDGLVTKATDAKGRVTRTEKNSQGWVIKATRNDLGTVADNRTEVTHDYDALGNVVSTNAAGVITTLTYDIVGRKIAMSDADMGNWAYGYNVLGELTSQTDAKLQVTTMTYDKLGRMTSRTEPDGLGGSGTITTNWTYDTATRGQTPQLLIGALASVAMSNGYLESYEYDYYGRPSKITRTIDGTPYETNYEHTLIGQLSKTVYPGNFAVRNSYNLNGFLKEIRRANHSTADLYWRATDYSVTGQIEGEYYGNGLANDRVYSAATGRLQYAAIDFGRIAYAPYAVQQLNYTYDRMGNVLSRYDVTTGRNETFEYDDLDRLTKHLRPGATTIQVTYNTLGNITSKTGVGAYGYHATKKHAVVSAGGNTYTYDANGNMLTGGNRTLTWTPFNQLSQIVQNGYTTNFTFGANRERIMQQGTGGAKTIYVGAHYEVVTNGGATEYRHYIMGPSGRIAVYTMRNSGVHDTRYFHTDGLGSVIAASNEFGQVVQRFAYDAWGQRVNPADDAVITHNTNSGLTRGYTDHEHLDRHGLIHMNGRVYDPVLARFLSADPFVDSTTDAQSFNRYSYVNNNPMNATDPSGYFKLKDAVKIVAVVAAAFVTAGVAVYATAAVMGQAGVTMGVAFKAMVGAGSYGLTATGAVAAGAGAGFASGFTSSLINGQSIGDAFKAGAVGGIVGGITGGLAHGVGSLYQAGRIGFFGRMLAHGTVQGAASHAQGAQFRHGFYSGFFTAGASPAIRASGGRFTQIVAAALVGGTASALGGGKFANGAVSGSFQYLLNDTQHKDNSRFAANPRWGQFFKGVAQFAGGALLGVGTIVAEVGSVGLATPLAILAAGTSGTSMTVGIGNMVAAFSADEVIAQKMAGAPSTVPQIAGRLIGGKTGQNAVGIVEGVVNISANVANHAGRLEQVQAVTELSETVVNDYYQDNLGPALDNAMNPGRPVKK